MVLETHVPLALLLPALTVLAGVALALVGDSFERRSGALWLLVVALSGAAIAGVWLSLGGELVATPIFVGGGGFVTLGSLGYLLTAAAIAAGYRRFVARDRGVAMAVLMALGAVFAQALIATLDLVVFFVALAGLAIVAYALVAGAGTRRAEESAIRYFVQGTVASGLTVYGLAVTLGLAGGATSYLSTLTRVGGGAMRPALLAMGLLVSAVAFKIGVFPFHSWVPDAYETADAPVAAYLGSVPKIAGVIGLAVLARGTLFSGPEFSALTEILAILAVGSLLFGAFGMLGQRSVGRLLGYSAIAQVGYALMGLAGGSTGVNAAAIHMVAYAIGACAAFVGLEAVMHVRPRWDGSLEGLAGLSREAPLLSACLVAVMLSLTGIPLLGGFWGKLLTLLAAIEADLLWLAVVAVVAAVVSFAGYGSVVRWMYFHTESETEPVEGMARGGAAVVVLVALTVALALLGLVPLVFGMTPVYALFGL